MTDSSKTQSTASAHSDDEHSMAGDDQANHERLADAASSDPAATAVAEPASTDATASPDESTPTDRADSDAATADASSEGAPEHTELSASSDQAPAAAAEEASEAEGAAAEQESSGDASDIAPAETSEPAPSEETPEATLEAAVARNPQLALVIEANENKARMAGTVIGWNKGGFHVSLSGVPAFCPKSQIELGKPKRAAAYIDREFDFNVLEIKDAGKRIVVSRRHILKADREQLLETLRAKAKSGEPMKGKVTSITDFGAFVDLGGIEGLVHLSQLTRRRIETPQEAVQTGQEVEVRVLKVEKAKQDKGKAGSGERISLSMKALEPDPWQSVEERFPVGSEWAGTIARRTDFGFFVDLGNGLEGLVHTSQLALGKSMDDEEYSIGSEIKGWIREADGERRRLSLTQREQAKTNPWKDLIERYSEGSEVDGQVEQTSRFGVFVQLEPGLTGLLPYSSLPRQPGRPPQRQFTAGQSLRVQISAIDTKRRRLTLSPVGAKLEGTRADLREYQKKQKQSQGSGLGALAAAFAKIQNDS